MPDASLDNVTVLLDALARGDASAADRMFPLVYRELRALAARQLRRERSGHTLAPTALVHEAYLKLVGQREASWRSRGHFLAVAATAMRRVLVNHAKARRRLKRGGDRSRLEIDEIANEFERRATDLVALDGALDRLRARSPLQADIVELRFFGGLTVEQAALALDVSERSVHREWAVARAWLRGEVDDATRHGATDGD
jgi:RNA polymerase sigma-70 factor (ECF subfamily)